MEIGKEDMDAWIAHQREVARRLAESASDDAIRLEVAKRREMLDSMTRRFGSVKPGTIIKFDRIFYQSQNVYSYAALYTGTRWYVTGRESPQGIGHTELALWLVGSSNAHPVSVDDITFIDLLVKGD